MIEYEEYQKIQMQNMNRYKDVITKFPIGVKCPKCESEIYKDYGIVYTSYPPKFRYFCSNCDWEKIDF